MYLQTNVTKSKANEKRTQNARNSNKQYEYLKVVKSLMLLFYTKEEGASSNPCSLTYGGSGPASEIETQNTVNYLSKYAGDRGCCFVDWHSYSQLMLYPWGYTTDFAPNNQDMEDAAKAFCDGLGARYKTEFTHGSSSRALCKFLLHLCR